MPSNTMYELNHRRIFLLLTTGCNLHCQYCFERGKHFTSMNFDVIKNVLQDELKDDHVDYQITFHGGEPFLQFSLIQQTVEWVQRKYTNYHILFDVTTNGTILTPHMRQWLIAHQDLFTISLSLDGPQEVHNTYRDNSFDRIDIDFYRSLHHCKVKMTVSPPFLHRMFDDYIYLTELGFDVSPSLAQEVEWPEELYLDIYDQQLNQFVDYQLSHPQKGLPPFFRYNIAKLSPSRRCQPSLRGCGVYFNTIGYDTKGICYPCNGFLNDFNRKIEAQEMEHLNHIFRTIPDAELLSECEGCIIQPVCSTCYALNYVYRGSIEHINKQMCSYLIHSIYATASIWAQAINSGKDYIWMRELSPLDILDTISGIMSLHQKS